MPVFGQIQVIPHSIQCDLKLVLGHHPPVEIILHGGHVSLTLIRVQVRQVLIHEVQCVLLYILPTEFRILRLLVCHVHIHDHLIRSGIQDQVRLIFLGIIQHHRFGMAGHCIENRLVVVYLRLTGLPISGTPSLGFAYPAELLGFFQPSVSCGQRLPSDLQLCLEIGEGISNSHFQDFHICVLLHLIGKVFQLNIHFLFCLLNLRFAGP